MPREKPKMRNPIPDLVKDVGSFVGDLIHPEQGMNRYENDQARMRGKRAFDQGMREKRQRQRKAPQ